MLDADDQNPRFVDEKYSAWLPDKNQAGERLDLMPRTIKAIDPDIQLAAPIEYELSSVGAGQIGWDQLHSYLKINSNGQVLLTRSIPNHLLHSAATLVVRATQSDNRDRYALTTLSILGKRQSIATNSATSGPYTSAGNSENTKLRFSNHNYSAICAENAPEGQLIVTVQVQRAHSTRPVSFQLLDDHNGHFTIATNGEIRLQKTLDYEKQQLHVFRVLASDGLHSDLCNVRISVQDVNDHDPQFAQAYYSFYVPANRLRSNAVIGELRASDADAGDRVNLSIKGPFANHFRISPSGQLRLVTLATLNVTQCHLIVQATDTGVPPRSTSVPVTVQFPATALLRGTTAAGRPLIGSADEDDLLNTIDSDDRRQPMERAQRTDFGLSSGWFDVNALFTAGSASALALVVVLGVLLATLFIIIITLSVHVLKQRKMAVDGVSAISNSTQHSGTNSPVDRHSGHGPMDTLSAIHSLGFGSRFYSASMYKPDLEGCSGGSAGPGSDGSPEPAALHSTEAFGGYLQANRVMSASALTAQFATLRPLSVTTDRIRLESDSAIASDSSSNDGKHMHGMEKSNRSNSGDSGCGSGCNSNGALDNGLSSGGGGGLMAKLQRWHVNSSIPRRVKKLTWEDERLGGGSASINQHSTIGVLSPNVCLVRSECELDPDVSVTPLRPGGQMYHRHTDKVTPDVTVYF